MEVTEEMLAKQKIAVDAMRNAGSHMRVALDRIALLEMALKNAADALDAAKRYIGPDAYTYSSSPQISVHKLIGDQAAEARRKLG